MVFPLKTLLVIRAFLDKYHFTTPRKVPHDIYPNKALITILSFTAINNNNVNLDLIQGLDIILSLYLIPYLDRYQFFLVFHVFDICPLLDKYQKHKILRKNDIFPKEYKYQ